MYRRARAKAGLEDVRIHDMRRKAGSDVDEQHAQELLAHADPKTTRRHYRAKPVRVRPDSGGVAAGIRDSAEALAALHRKGRRGAGTSDC